MASMAEPLDTIRARIAAVGRITFAEFMELALYGPRGYYTRAVPRIGPEGDFYTSPTVHPAFGTLVGGQVRQVWELAGRPERFDVLELGGGRGTLAADILHSWKVGAPDLLAAARYTLCDIADPRFEPQAPAILGRARYRPAAAGLPAAFSGVILANEFLDALPVHRVQKLQGKLQELFVVAVGDQLVESPGPLSSEDLALQVEPWAADLPEGGVAEVHLAMLDWCRNLAESLESGVVLLIDYGADRRDLLARKGGTLRGYRRHRFLATPFEAIGQADLTCHVDFCSLRSCAERHGLDVLGETSQADFLQNLGMAQISAALSTGLEDSAAREANLAALADLGSPQGFGGFRVLALGKGPSPRLSGLGQEPPLEPLCAPALTRRHMALWGPGRGRSAWQEVDAQAVLGELFAADPVDLD